MTKILVVDDSSFARNNLRRTLEGMGYEVVQADSGEVAIQMAKFETPDIATLDLLMPGMSGQETLAKLVKISPNTKYIIITADIQENTRQEVLALGANAFLNKPIQADILRETIKTLIEKG